MFFFNVCAGFPILKLREFSYALFMYIDMTVMFLNFVMKDFITVGSLKTLLCRCLCSVDNNTVGLILKLLNYERKDMSRYNYPASSEVVDVVGQLCANPLAIHGINLFTM